MHRRDVLKGTVSFAALAGLKLQTAAAVRTVRTSVLEIGYHDSGDPAGFPIILLHGFPDDAQPA